METYEFMNSMGERENRMNQIYAAWAKRHGMNYNILAVLYTTYKNDQCSQKFVCEECCLPKQEVEIFLKFIGKFDAPMPNRRRKNWPSRGSIGSAGLLLGKDPPLRRVQETAGTTILNWNHINHEAACITQAALLLCKNGVANVRNLWRSSFAACQYLALHIPISPLPVYSNILL